MLEVIPDTADEGTDQGRCPTGPVCELVGNVMAGGHLGHKDNQIIEFIQFLEK